MTARQLRWVLLCAVSACTGLTVGNTPVAIEFVQPPASITVGQTDTLHIRVLDRSGDSLPGAPIVVMSLDTHFLRVDSLPGQPPAIGWTVTGLTTDSAHSIAARVVATTGKLQSIPLVITVDSI